MTIQELLALLLSGDLSALTDEELSAHETTLQNEFDERRANGVRGAEALSELAQIVDACDAIRGEAGSRIEAAVAEEQAVADLEARLRPAVEEIVDENDPDPEAPPADPEPEPDPEPEAVEEEVVEVEKVAVAASVPARPARLSSVRSDKAPAPVSKRARAQIIGEPSVPVSRLSVAQAFMDADSRYGTAPFSMNHPIVRFVGDYPEARQLSRRNPEANEAKLSALISPAAMQAGAMTASALCGPATPRYDLPFISSATTPFADGLAGFSVSERGKVTFNRPFAISDFSGAVGTWTDADNEDEQATKNCDTIECADSVDAEVLAFTRCLTINNFFGRYNPEMVANAVDATAVNWAKMVETFYLDQVKAASTQTVAGRALGSLADWQYTLRVAAASYRSSSRMLQDADLVASFPSWLIDNLGGDLGRAQHSYADQLRWTRSEMESVAASMNVRLTFYIDTPSTGTSQVFAAQGVGNLIDYPEFVQWGLWHEGAHVRLDGGPEINFGITRDAASNLVNTYQTFAESAEGYAFFGIKSLWVTQALCASGTFSAPDVVLDDVCGGGSVPGS